MDMEQQLKLAQGHLETCKTQRDQLESINREQAEQIEEYKEKVGYINHVMSQSF